MTVSKTRGVDGTLAEETTVRTTKAESAALAAALAAMLFGSGVVVAHWDPTEELLAGLTLLILGAMAAFTTLLWALLRYRTAEAHDHFERGRSIGHARGYREGRREARPVVVEAWCPSCGEQLGQQRAG